MGRSLDEATRPRWLTSPCAVSGDAFGDAGQQFDRFPGVLADGRLPERGRDRADDARIDQRMAQQILR